VGSDLSIPSSANQTIEMSRFDLFAARSYLKESMAREEGRNELRSEWMAISGATQGSGGDYGFP